MAREELLDAVALPPGNVHRIQAELPPEQAAERYEEELRDFFGGGGPGHRPGRPAPRFDLLLLGLGADCHTASLFPGSPLLGETERWVGAVSVPSLRAWRVTLTPRATNAAARVAFIVAGAGKAEAVRRALAAGGEMSACPARAVAPADGRVVWLLDGDAAGLLG
jgi:6-phosphogluconolactonase